MSGKREITFDEKKLMLVFIGMTIPFVIGCQFLFHVIWHGRDPHLIFEFPLWTKILMILVAVILHELIHGLVFSIYAPKGFRSVHFGFNRELASPYCHCNEPLKIKHYRRAGIAPLIVLGILPLIMGMVTGSSWMKTFGMLLSVGGFGDLLVWIKLLQFNADRLVLDHPHKMGFILEE